VAVIKFAKRFQTQPPHRAVEETSLSVHGSTNLVSILLKHSSPSPPTLKGNKLVCLSLPSLFRNVLTLQARPLACSYSVMQYSKGLSGTNILEGTYHRKLERLSLTDFSRQVNVCQ
jgi:hypothetical protein